MTDIAEPRNNLAWRVTVLEREVGDLKKGQPEVVAFQVAQLTKQVEALEREVKEDMAALRSQIHLGDEIQAKQIRDFRRIFVGAFTTVGAGIVVAIVALIVTGGGSP